MLASDAVRLSGNLASLSMDFSSGSAARITGITLSFSIDVLLWPGDVVSLQLGGFTSFAGV